MCIPQLVKMVKLDLEEVDTLTREEWRSVEINNGGEYVMINGMIMTPLLYVGNWDFQNKVIQK